MWKCKHCNQEFNINQSQRANHSRWCVKNPKREQWNKNAHAIKTYGNFKEYEVQCACCNKSFVVNERETLFPSKEKYFCSRSCANTIGGRAKRDKYGIVSYDVIARNHYEPKCVVCDYDEVIDVHHIDENRHNNDPKNLVFLCPNHHALLHRKQASLVKSSIETFILEHWGS